MKYGMRERISGAVILIALAVIFVPMLFDEPAPRDERPQPMLTIEQPVAVERRNVPDPQPPESLGQIRSPGISPAQVDPQLPLEGVEPGDVARVDPQPAVAVQQGEAGIAAGEPAPPADAPRQDPIADLAQAASERVESNQPPAASPEPQPSGVSASPGGEWAVQVGSFGEPGNAERLQARLREEGFPVYSRRRDNNMTTVYVGPFDTSESGERAMATVKERANLQGLLVRVRD
ncbi:MAG: SPOR domain-containing protein [Halomonas sp.]|nr:SPOR domain-containing protein [Halomonas sp.]MCC5881558.1 SPOR domain-containing protein [Halomonas sp.]